MINKAEVAYWLMIKYINITICVVNENPEKPLNDHVDQPFEEAKEVTQVALQCIAWLLDKCNCRLFILVWMWSYRWMRLNRSKGHREREQEGLYFLSWIMNKLLFQRIYTSLGFKMHRIQYQREEGKERHALNTFDCQLLIEVLQRSNYVTLHMTSATYVWK